MDIGKEHPAITIEPLESPVPGQEPERMPDPVRETPDPVRQPEKVPA